MASPVDGPPETIRVLHVDDEPGLADLVATRLPREDGRLSVATATSAEEGLRRLDEESFDCVVSDYDMPGADGLAFLRSVRESQPDLPFILYTGEGSEAVASEAISADVTDYLKKEAGTDQYAILANRIRHAVDRHRARRALERSERRLRDIVDRLPHPLYVVDEEGRYRLANDALAELHGTSVDEIEGARVADRLGQLDPERYEQFRREVDQVLASGEHCRPGEFEFSDAAGESHVVEPRLYPHDLGGGEGRTVLGMAVDVTERKERERALRRYERVVNTMPAGAAIYDEAGRFELVNEYLANTYETSRSALIGEKGRLVPQVRRQGDGDRFQALLDGAREEARDEVEIEFAHKENEVVDYRLAPFRTDGEIDGVVAVAYDISERKARERELETLRDRMEFVFEVTDSHVWTAEFETGATETYGDTEPLYGRPAEEVQRTEVFYDLVHPDDRPRLRRAFEAVSDGDRDTFEVEYRTNPAQGEVRWLHSQARLREESDARRLVGLTTDVTERKRHERRLTRQKDRLEEFTSVVSHDLRNPLSVAKGRVELARETGETEQLEPARHALERSQSLIDDLLTLARSGEELGTTEPVELGAVVEECWRTVESPNATLVADTDRTVRADRSRLRQLLENLLRNAVDHGEAAVTVTVGDADDGFYVADDGPGIPMDDRERVFEPGYTTTDRGTGLGLAIVNRIAAAHDWEIAVTESAAGGARFDVTGVEAADP